ncbi:MAG: hydantoinase/oxoprolinase family protein [Pseudomonadota bacterium]|nr:hydantoinase/oxoprolinase family protein [Pseudomonadota bacterium]
MKISIQSPPWRVGVDVGGTFTDLVIADSEGRTDVFKVPSVPSDPGEGAIAALKSACAALGQPISQFLGDCQFFLHGSTVATNTLLEGKGATVGLLTTEGFRDSLEARRGLRKDPWDHRTPYPPVLVPRYLRRPVRGRIDAHGHESKPVNLDDVRAACRSFAEEGVESVAICLLNSFINSVHEQAVAEVVSEENICKWISVSSDIVPIMGEYERSSTTAVNAYVMPRVASYLGALNEKLKQMGLKTKLLMLQSNGGAASLDQLIRQPVNLLLSGPSAGVGAMQHLAAGIGENNLVSMEIGGTSCDVMLMHEGRVAITDSLSVNDYDLVTPSVDIHTVGAGGGTVAGIDGAGLMYAGPEGAGANPGPAAYGLGGARPTVTDAHLVLGRMRPGSYAGGSVSLDLAAAENAIDTEIAKPTGISRTEAAAGVIRIVEQNLLHAVERISIQRGYNPGRFTLIACGGAGPMHGASVGRRLGARAVYIPRQAGAFCAIGMQHADVRRDFVHVVMRELDDNVGDVIGDGYRQLEAQALRALEDEGFQRKDTEFGYELDLHYEGQQWDVRVTLSPHAKPAEIRNTFEAEYDRQFGHTNPESRINVAKLRVVGIGKLPALQDPTFKSVDTVARPFETRPVYAESAGCFLDTSVFRGTDLQYGQSFVGPAVIEEATTTVLVGPNDRVMVDALNNYMISFEPSS